ncbi:PAS domain-containing protein [Roseiterribacter gracilis]|uniref:PAS domain-containing protein n=1 Tax=Roseiterribacter gracilis TaxID=2812848 RepID=A0A8S8X8N6_9PROT|nr:hypothetical protein TMPK1_01160 [Rhodospirillales bacterium TMPK1]
MNDTGDDARRDRHVGATPFRDPAFAAALSYEPARALYGVWSAAWRGDALPEKRAVTPPYSPVRVIANLFMHEAHGERFLCRLTGSRVDEIFGSNGAGKYLDEMLTGEALQSRADFMHRCLQEQTALIYAGRLFPPNRQHVQSLRLLLPVQEASTGMRLIVGVAWFPDGSQQYDRFGKDTNAATLVAIEQVSQA